MRPPFVIGHQEESAPAHRELVVLTRVVCELSLVIDPRQTLAAIASQIVAVGLDDEVVCIDAAAVQAAVRDLVSLARRLRPRCLQLP